MESENYVDIAHNEMQALYLEWSVQHKKRFQAARRFYGAESTLYDPIEIYAGYGARDINAYLRGEVETCFWSCLINTLRLSILDAPRVHKNISVYRWVPRSIVEEMLSSESKTYYERGFMSTSLQQRLDYEYHRNDVLLHIKVKAGTPAVYVDNVVNRHEHELLFLDGSFLRYDGKKLCPKLRRFIYEVGMIRFDA